MAKVEATQNYGADVGARRRGASRRRSPPRSRMREETGATFVHAFEDERVIAGQGTIGLELAEQVPEARDGRHPGRRRRARRRDRARAARAAAAACGSSASRPGCDGGRTIADGIAVKQPGELTWAILDDVLDDLVSVTDEEISEAIVLLLERSKLVVEGAGAVAVAALLTGKVGWRGAGGARSSPAATSTRRC